MQLVKTCTCGGNLIFEGMHLLKLDLGPAKMRVDLYLCDACGKMEFYQHGDQPEDHLKRLKQTYSDYSGEKLHKILEDGEYTPEAKEVADEILRLRGE